MKVVLQNPSTMILGQIEKKFDCELFGTDELVINRVCGIKDMRKIASCDFALYRKDSVIYVDNADFSSMEVQI